MNLDAVLKVRADVQGQGEIDGLSRSFGNLDKAAQGTQGKLGRLGQAARGLGGMFGALLPVGAIAGLAALGKRSIDTADNLNDMSQRTGVAVESLSKFGAAAEDSGSSIEGVAKGMGQLAKRVADTGKAGDEIRGTLKGMGISATDAKGNIKPLDTLMLEIANRFSKMPDGAEKSALAMKLFGKSGVELVPMLNQGREALEKYEATISGDMAKSADQFNDALNNISRSLAGPFNQAVTALLPSITKLAEGLAGALAAFSQLPQPIQTTAVAVGGLVAALVVLAPAINAIIALAGLLSGLGIGATIAGWAGAIGPAIAGITAALSAFAAWLTGTLLPILAGFFSGPAGWITLAVVALVAAAIAFREPLMKFAAWLWEWSEPVREVFVKLWDGLVEMAGKVFSAIGDAIKWAAEAWIAILWQIFVQPWINIWNGLLREPVTKLLDWVSEQWDKISKGFDAYVVQPITKAWSTVASFIPDAMAKARDTIVKIWNGLVDMAGKIFNAIGDAIKWAAQAWIAVLYQIFVQPWVNIWNNLLREPVLRALGWVREQWTKLTQMFEAYVVYPIKTAWQIVARFIPDAMTKARDAVVNVWKGIINTIKGVMNGVLNAISSNMNKVINELNFLISKFNQLPGPDIGLIPKVNFPQFAEGGTVSRPTLAMVGEGGEREYIVPESKMARASANYLAGARGDAVLAGSRGGNGPVINITTGPVMEFNGERYVTVGDMERAMRATAQSVIGTLRKPSARIALGIA
jgi:phage-related protein